MKKNRDLDIGSWPDIVWKMYLTMKICVCLLILGLSTVSARTHSQTRLTLDAKNKTLPEIFQEITRLSGYEFMYSSNELRHVGKVSVQVEDRDLSDILAECLKNTGLWYRLEDDVIVISPKLVAPQEAGKELTVTGTVKDKGGMPLPGVTILLKGTQLGGVTDADGKFRLTLPDNREHVLIFSFVGMKIKEIRVNDAKPLMVVMEEDATEMDEVVVTGIFKKARESYTGSVSTVTNEQLKLFRGQNLLQTLKNIDVSINLTEDNYSGSNPNTLPQINIRGNSSLPMSVSEYNALADNSVNTPLIIMDGFEIGLERLMDYNDEEIESINILKDAAATAIYGSRGANGVIVVVTKKPEAGKMRVNAEVGVNLEIPDLTSYDMLNAAEKLQLEWDLGLYNMDSPSSDMTYKNTYARRLREVVGGTDVDWLSKPLRVGSGMRYNLRLEGGSREFRWSISGAYNDTRGAMKDSYRSNFNGSITLMYSVKNLIFRNSTTYGLSRSSESKYGTFSDYVKQQPYNSPYDANGKLVKTFEHFSGSPGQTGEANPLYDATLNSFNKSGYTSLSNNFSVEWQVVKGLTLRGQVGISSTDNTSDYFLPAEHTFFQSAEYKTTDGFLRRGQYKYSTGKGNNYDGSINLAYSETFADKHQIYLGVDYSLRERNNRSYSFDAEGFMDEDVHFLASARQYQENGKPGGNQSTMRSMGLAANLNYIYNNRYYADFSLRVDGNSSFGSKKKYGTFWSSGIGWNVHNEKFMEGFCMNVLRLKASYGQTGSQQGSTGASTLYNILTDNYYMNWTIAELQNLGNPYLTWQTTDEFNFGVEFGLWQSRFKGEFNVYSKKTSNLLSNMDLPHSTGFSSYVDNVGEVKNTGWEASASVYLMRNAERDMTWMVTGQLAYNKNIVSKLSEAIKEQTESYLQSNVDVANLFYEGRPQNGLYVVRSLGIDPSNGEEVFLDKNGNRTDTWQPSDKVYVGQTEARYRGIANTMFMWKGLTVNLSAGFHWGGKQYNSTLVDRVEVSINTVKNRNVDARALYERWQKPGDIVSFRKFDDNTTRASSRFVMPDKVFQIQSVSVQYRWDNDWIKKNLHASSLTFGVNMSDLLYVSTVKRERGTSYPFAHNIQASIKFLF